MKEITEDFCNLRTIPKLCGVDGANIPICTATKHNRVFKKKKKNNEWTSYEKNFVCEFWVSEKLIRDNWNGKDTYRCEIHENMLVWNSEEERKKKQSRNKILNTLLEFIW